jgi:hypothetical protein
VLLCEIGPHIYLPLQRRTAYEMQECGNMRREERGRRRCHGGCGAAVCRIDDLSLRVGPRSFENEQNICNKIVPSIVLVFGSTFKSRKMVSKEKPN